MFAFYEFIDLISMCKIIFLRLDFYLLYFFSSRLGTIIWFVGMCDTIAQYCDKDINKSFLFIMQKDAKWRYYSIVIRQPSFTWTLVDYSFIGYVLEFIAISSCSWELIKYSFKFYKSWQHLMKYPPINLMVTDMIKNPLFFHKCMCVA